MRFVQALLAALAFAANLAPARAATPEAAGAAGAVPTPAAPSVRIATLLLRAADSPIDAGLADSLTEVLITSLATTGRFEIVGKEEVKALLKVDDEMRALECIVSPACLGALATHLRVAKALVGTIGKDASGFLVSLNLVNLTTGETEQSKFLKVEGDVGALTEKLSAVAVEAATPRPPPGSVSVTANVAGAEVIVDDASIGRAPARKAGLSAGTHRVRVVKPGYLDWSADVPVAAGADVELAASLKVDPGYVAGVPPARVAFIALATGAGAAGVVSAVLGALVLTRTSAAEGATLQVDAFAHRDAAKRFALAANIGFGVAGGAALGAVIVAIAGKGVFSKRKGSADAGAPAAKGAFLVPLVGGGLAAVEVAW